MGKETAGLPNRLCVAIDIACFRSSRRSLAAGHAV